MKTKDTVWYLFPDVTLSSRAVAVTWSFLPQWVREVECFPRISGKQWVNLIHGEDDLLPGQQLVQSLHSHSGPIHFHVHEQLLQHEQRVRGQVGIVGPVLLRQGQQDLLGG